MILSCTCVNEYQDKLHGKGMRVMNQTATAPNSAPAYRCTICLKIKQAANTTPTVIVKKESV